MAKGKEESQLQKHISFYINRILLGVMAEKEMISQGDYDQETLEDLQDLRQELSQMFQRISMFLEEHPQLPLGLLWQRVPMSLFERFCLLLLQSLEKDYVLFSLFQNLFGTPFLTEKVAMQLYMLASPTGEEPRSRLGELSLLRKDGVISITPPLIYFLRENQWEQRENLWELPPLMLYDSLLEGILPSLGKDSGKTLQITGPSLSGKKFVTKHLAKTLEKDLVLFDLGQVKGKDVSLEGKKMEELLLFSLLCRGIVYLYGITKEKKEEMMPIYQQWVEALSPHCWLLVVATEEKESVNQQKLPDFLYLSLDYLSLPEKIQVWTYFQSVYQVKDLNPISCGNRYPFHIGEIKNIFTSALLLASGEVRESHILQAIKVRGNTLEGADFIQTAFTLNDLVLDSFVEEQLHHLMNQLKFKHVVYHQWGFDKKIPYGRGISALFYGPPGTGKTMTASVIANELGMDLYRVDLSKLVSKYIGETEKNISALFDKAKHLNVVLFFDEADSLFAKRSEVKDANDKNANAETAHLLQKLEDYEGISLLATNLQEQIDDAFRRRFKFMIPFTLPDEKTRLTLWESVVPDPEFLDEDLDLSFFAEHFPLSGSQIKEIVLHASFMAVSEGALLGNQQMKEALTLNYQKYGKRMTESDFSYLM